MTQRTMRNLVAEGQYKNRAERKNIYNVPPDIERKRATESAKHIREARRRFKKGDSQMTADSLTALITGGTSGIGRATAKKLAKLGIRVIVVGRNAKRGDETLAEIRAAGGKADFIASDLRNASSAREVAKRAVELGSGHVDI